MFGASPARARFVASGLRPPVRVVHRIPGRGLIEMPPAVSQGRVVFGTHDGLVIAARVRDGARVWATNLGGCIASSPAVRAGIVYIGWSGAAPCGPGKDGRGGLVALGLDTGRVLWRFNAGNVEASPAIVDDMLFFSAFRTRRASRVYAMRLGDRPSDRAGATRSRPRSHRARLCSAGGSTSPRTTEASTASTAGAGGCAGGRRRSPRTRRRASCSVSAAWSGDARGPRAATTRRRRSPTTASTLGVIDGVFSAFDAYTGVHRWSRKLAGSIYGSAALWKETVYVGTTGGVFYALSASDGRTRWKRTLGGKILGSPTVTNGRVYIATTKRRDVRPRTPARARSNGASPTATTPRSSSPARAGSSSGRGGSTRSRTRRAGRLRARLAKPPPPRVPRARRAGTDPSRTRRPRRRPRASRSR